MFRDWINKITLRIECMCGGYGKKIDDYFLTCARCGNTWDGRDYMAQKNVLIRERNTVVDDL